MLVWSTCIAGSNPVSPNMFGRGSLTDFCRQLNPGVNAERTTSRTSKVECDNSSGGNTALTVFSILSPLFSLSVPRSAIEEDRSTWRHPALPEKSDRTSSLCNLCVLCASVVKKSFVKNNHRDTEDTEVAQRNRTFRAKPRHPLKIGFLNEAFMTCSRRGK